MSPDASRQSETGATPEPTDDTLPAFAKALADKSGIPIERGNSGCLGLNPLYKRGGALRRGVSEKSY
jgi:hypothetical protein